MNEVMRTRAIVALLAAVLLAPGCGSPARVVEGNDRVTTLGSIDIQDWEAAATELTQSMLRSKPFERECSRVDGPLVLAMSRIRNDTGDHIDNDLLTKAIRIALLDSGKAMTSTTFGSDAEDAKAASTVRAKEFFDGAATNRPALPNLMLSGKISKLTARAGDIRQATFVFQLSLTAIGGESAGLAIWEGSKQITKQGTKAAVGY